MMSQKNYKMVWLFQIIAGVTLCGAGVSKFLNNPVELQIFMDLGMEPFGRYIVGAWEVASGGFLLTSHMAAFGAIMGIVVMFGAALAHLTVLGPSINGDNGLHILMLLVVVISSGIVLFVRRTQIPLVGRTFE